MREEESSTGYWKYVGRPLYGSELLCEFDVQYSGMGWELFHQECERDWEELGSELECEFDGECVSGTAALTWHQEM